jgi:hypothetical protein
MATGLHRRPGVSGKTRNPGALARTPSLMADHRGAIMVIGIFIAMMLTALIYYVWGIGGAILFRERMQDCTDTAVFSAAVVHARGMNILVLLNLIMAALAAIEAGLHTAADGIEYAAYLALFTCLGCGPWCGYCCRACPYVGPYFSASRTADNIHSTAERIITPLMDFTHGVAVAVRVGSPVAGQALVVEWASSPPYSPVTQFGVMFPLIPGTSQLAAEDDPTNWPCDEKVYWPALIIAGMASLVEINFNVSEWYFGGMALAWLLDHQDNSRRYCPNRFQRVKEGAQLGEEPFQIRALVYGRSPHTWTRGGVALADWNRSDGSGGVVSFLEPLTNFAVAQAEYFYDNEPGHEREEWLWHQRWRARLRRFRLPEGGDGGLGDAIGRLGLGPGGLLDISRVVIH